MRDMAVRNKVLKSLVALILARVIRDNIILYYLVKEKKDMANAGFDALDNAASVENAAETKPVKEKNQHLQELKAAMQATIAEQGETIVNQFGTKAADIEVVKVLGYTDKGSLVETQKAVGKKGEPGYQPHKVAASPKNVGYIIKNNSTAPIAYVGTQCNLVDGSYVPTKVNLTLAPGAQAPIRKGDLTRLLSKIEYSLTAANGHLRPLASSVDSTDIEKKLENYTFSFDEGSVLERQEQIGVKGADGKWAVQDSYKAIFGDEENVVEKAKKAPAAKIAGTAYEANFIRRLLAEQGM